ncbi:MAG: rhomboid family intramembrane serine protease [Spirochaetales bacterium]|nr:rhomboid family intramembrane serine protease [Spirochaetales bacterium]
MMKDTFLNKKFKYTYSNAAVYIVLLNVFVFMLTYYSGLTFKGLPLVYWLSLIPGFVNMGWIWQFVTYMFVHSSVMHLFFNMFALIMFGRVLERTLGTREFLLFYFLCGILGGVINYVFNVIQGSLGVAIMGASGCIYALLFLCAVLFPTARLLLFFFIPMKMPYAVMLYIAIEIFSQIYGIANGVAHLIHLSCIAIAWLYVVIRFRLNPIQVWRENL